MRETEGMRYEVHRSPQSDRALPPCELAAAFVYRERVEDAQTLLDSAFKFQYDTVCHMHAVFVAWDVPFLKNQVRHYARESERKREKRRRERCAPASTSGRAV